MNWSFINKKREYGVEIEVGITTNDQKNGHATIVAGVKLSCLKCGKMVDFNEINVYHQCLACAQERPALKL